MHGALELAMPRGLAHAIRATPSEQTASPPPVDLGASVVTKLYGRRFTIEETFRDTKDVHFGMGLSAPHIGSAARRDRLLFLAALAYALLVLLGAASERCGLDRTLKASTTKRRTLSLYKQARHWYDAIPAMTDECFDLLMHAYLRRVPTRAR